jgi:hypothetical protein
VVPLTLRADTSVPLLELKLSRARNDAFSKSTNVKSSATYDIPTRRFRRLKSDAINGAVCVTQKRLLVSLPSTARWVADD